MFWLHVHVVCSSMYECRYCSDGTGSSERILILVSFFFFLNNINNNSTSTNKFCRILPQYAYLSLSLSPILFFKVHWLSLSSAACAPLCPCAAALVHHSFVLFKSFVTPLPSL